MIDVDRIHRWRATTQTWCRKSVALLLRQHEDASNDGERWLVGYEAEAIMNTALFELDSLVPLLNLDQIEDVERYARSLATRIRDHRVAAQLENVVGRSPGEAETFLAKAAELRERSRA